MKLRNLYLLSFLVLLAACSGSEEKVLYPTKMTIGGTTHEFLYDHGRIYSVTTTRPDFYEEVTYRYYDEYTNDPEHRFKDKIFEINYEPDYGAIGWDRSDSVDSIQEMLERSDTGIIEGESQNVYLPNRTEGHSIMHKYNDANQLSETNYYFYDTSVWNKRVMEDNPKYIAKRVKYGYGQGKLARVAYYGHMSDRPYLLIELTYDDKPGYLRNLPLEARFLPLELPYRDHNIVSYTVKDIYGKVRKDLSYTCSYSYNKSGYPVKFTRRMGDGAELEGYITYKAAASKLTELLSVK